MTKIRAAHRLSRKNFRRRHLVADRRVVRGLLTVGLVALLQLAPCRFMATADTAVTQDKCTTTAAEAHGWGPPEQVETFNTPEALESWRIYDGPGHNGNGRRTPTAVSIADGSLVVKGDAAGNSGGLAWPVGRRYGRWELCFKSSAPSNYHSVLLLWPDSENWPADGEIDFSEILDRRRQVVTASVLRRDPRDPPPADDPNYHASIAADATEWHCWAVEWTPDGIVGFLDGGEWFHSQGNSPIVPMHLGIQLDNMGDDVSEGGQLSVNWVREYPVGQ